MDPESTPASHRPTEGNAIPKSRLDAVIQQLEARTSALKVEHGSTPFLTAEDKAPALDLAAAMADGARQELDEAQAVEVVGAFSPRRFTGGLTVAQKEKLVREKQVAAEKSQGNLDNVGSMKPRDQIEFELNRAGELHKANEEQMERGGPLDTSPEMRSALEMQTKEANRLKRETEENYPLYRQQWAYRLLGLTQDVDQMMPTGLLERIMENAHPSELTPGQEEKIRVSQVFFEEAKRYAEARGLEIDLKAYEAAATVLKDTQTLTEAKTIYSDRYRNEKGIRAGWAQMGYYHGGVAAIEDLFSDLQRRGRTLSDSEKPLYILAFVSGILNNCTSVRDVPHHLRDWLAETIPGDDGQGLGLNYFALHEKEFPSSNHSGDTQNSGRFPAIVFDKEDITLGSGEPGDADNARIIDIAKRLNGAYEVVVRLIGSLEEVHYLAYKVEDQAIKEVFDYDQKERAETKHRHGKNARAGVSSRFDRVGSDVHPTEIKRIIIGQVVFQLNEL